MSLLRSALGSLVALSNFSVTELTSGLEWRMVIDPHWGVETGTISGDLWSAVPSNNLMLLPSCYRDITEWLRGAPIVTANEKETEPRFRLLCFRIRIGAKISTQSLTAPGFLSIESLCRDIKKSRLGLDFTTSRIAF